jgi:DNA-binding winged helix-turn-helix (wHTH) protein/tetratricopeptide (TPR) repeat protein
MSPGRLFVFDQYRLDAQERQLVRGAETVPLPPKLFDLLATLVRNPGHLIHKQDLLDRVWSDVAVEEASLTRGISSLRRVLGSTRDGHDFIQTVSKRGYRFLVDVRDTTDDEQDRTRVATRMPLPPPLVATEAVDFVGREAELTHMDDAWQRAKSGQQQLLLIAGEPGIGKTRLALEFARRRAAEGSTVLVGSSDEEHLVPYQPFVESLTWYVHRSSEADLRAHMAAIGGAELSAIVPELRTHIPDLPVPATVDPEGQRYRLFEAVAMLLAVASQSAPMLLVFDDLHWADKPTLLLLRHLIRSARGGSFCIVATYRESEVGRTHALADILVGLRREARVTRLVLRGLDLANVTALADSIVGPDASCQLAAALIESTDGNPFFATEMLLHLKETGATARVTGSATDLEFAGFSEGIKEVIGRRLSRLSDACNRVLGVAAVIGRQCDAALLEAVADLPESELLDALEEAMRAQLIRESREMSGRFEFVHALIRATLHGELSSPRRAKWHQSVAEAIERRAQTMAAPPPLAELAYHYSQAAAAGAADKALEYAVRAGDRAAEGLAHEEAARLFDTALQSLEFRTAGAETAPLRVDLHTRRARCFDALGQWGPEVRELQAALSLLNPEHVERRCELVLALARASFLLLDVGPVERYATEALQLAERVQRSDLAANAVAWLARCRQTDGDLGAAIDMDRRAMSRAPGVVTAAHMLGPLTLYLAGRAAEAIPLAIDAAAAARTSGDTTFVMYAIAHLGLNMSAAGRYAEALDAFQEVRTFGRRYGVLPMLARATAMAGGLHLSLFDFEAAEALQCEARELGRSAGFAPSIVSAGIDSLLTFARRHEPGRAERLLEETAAAATSTGGWHQWLWQLRLSQAKAELALERGAFDEAIAIAASAIEYCRMRGRPKYETLGLITKARGLHALGRTRDAIADAKRALSAADGTGDPALLLIALDALLALDGTDDVAARARAVTDRIHLNLPDEVMHRCFMESEVVRRIRTSC